MNVDLNAFNDRNTSWVNPLNPLKSVQSNLHTGPIFNIPPVVLTSEALPSGVCATLRFWPSAAVSQFYGILAAILQVSVLPKKRRNILFFPNN